MLSSFETIANRTGVKAPPKALGPEDIIDVVIGNFAEKGFAEIRDNVLVIQYRAHSQSYDLVRFELEPTFGEKYERLTEEASGLGGIFVRIFAIFQALFGSVEENEADTALRKEAKELNKEPSNDVLEKFMKDPEFEHRRTIIPVRSY